MKTNQQTMGPNAHGNDRRRQYRKDRQFSRATFLRRRPKNADLTGRAATTLAALILAIWQTTLFAAPPGAANRAIRYSIPTGD